MPDLSSYRRAQPLTLAGRHFASWDAVDPPRVLDHEATPPYWELPWVREWETFRRHLVDLHYDELSRWLVEAGILHERIWSSQGLMAPEPWAMPFALAVASPVKNYDSGGMSVEGAKPARGHLGAILYGASAQNAIRMEGPRSLFGAFAAIDPQWAVVEFNSADLSQPTTLPTYADAYRGLRDMWNYGARFVSPMAWSARAWRLVVLTDGAAPRTLRFEGRQAKDAPWVALAAAAEARLSPGRAGTIDALRIELEFDAPAPVALVRVAILPDRNAGQR